MESETSFRFATLPPVPHEPTTDHDMRPLKEETISPTPTGKQYEFPMDTIRCMIVYAS